MQSIQYETHMMKLVYLNYPINGKFKTQLRKKKKDVKFECM